MYNLPYMAQDESFRGEKRYIKPSLKNPRGRGRRIDGGKNFDDNDPDMDRESILRGKMGVALLIKTAKFTCIDARSFFGN